MASYIKVPADGVTQIFPVPSRYLSRDHIRVMRNGITLWEPGDYEWINDTQVRFRTPPESGALIEIRRVTPDANSLVTFNNGAVLSAEDLNTAALQSLLRAEELQDQIDGYLTSSLIRYALGGSAGALLPEEMIAAAAQEILASPLALSLQEGITDIAANAEAILAQTLRLDGIDATIQTIETLATDGYNAMAARLDLLGAVSGNNQAFILNTSTVRVSPTESLATRLEQLQVSDSNNFAAIQTLQNVVTGPGGLTAQWTVKTDVNGYVAGFGLYNSGATSDFIVLADRFAIITPGQGKKVPFSIVGGVVYMQNVVIQDALIQSLTISKLSNGTLNSDISVGTGKIVWSNGSYMKVAGVGFGTANQFIEWFGPVMSINSCSESNAISYLKTNGSAYFGGTLSVGTLKNAASSSSLMPDASITIGPFTTNGNTKSVVVSYGLNGRWEQGGVSGVASASGPTSATIHLYRTMGTGAEALVATLNVSGSWSYTTENNIRYWEQNMGGSTTYTDTSPGTLTRSFRATIAARTTGFNPLNGTHTQGLSLVSTEQ